MIFFNKLLFFLTNFVIAQDFAISDNNKLNIVLFFTKNPPYTKWLDDAGLKFLNFEQTARIKHCADTTSISEQSQNLGFNQELVQNPDTSCSNCKKLLKSGILCLINFAKNALGMATAIVTLNNDSFADELRFKKSKYHNDLPFNLFNSQKTIAEKENKLNKLPNIVKDSRLIKNVPVYNIYSPLFRFNNNNNNKWRNRPNVNNYLITEPQHSEMFKIRSKRQEGETEPEIPDLSIEQKLAQSKSGWDLLGFISAIKMTFFGKFLGSGKDETTNRFNSNNIINQPQDNCLFNLIKKALSNIQENSNSNFLLIVMGGDLTDISNVYSPLIQSIKHITENTNENNTMIIVTGSCRTDKNGNINDNGVVEMGEGQLEDELIPLYVKGNGLYKRHELKGKNI